MDGSGGFRFYYVLAAKGIQDFLLRGGKLRLMVGGSELVENLPGSFLNSILDALGLRDGIDYRVLCRNAGGARLLFREEPAVRELARCLPLALSAYAPGLEAVQAVVEVKAGLAAAMGSVERELQQRRNLPAPSYPVPGPLVARCPRSGLPAVDWFRQGNEKEPADVSMVARDQARKSARRTLVEKVLPVSGRNGEGRALRPMPDDFEALASEETSFLALVHADGNSLGQQVMAFLRDMSTMSDAEAADRYACFCRAIEDAAQRAVREALEPIVEAANADSAALYPFRPLVVAGDDVTIVLRAQDALSFTSRFLNAFEEATAQEMGRLAKPGLRLGGLTASAGIAYVKRNYPFAQAYELCESLCKYAKDGTQRRCSSLAFWRLTSAVAGSMGEIVSSELTTPDGCRLTRMPYVTGAASRAANLPSVDALDALCNALLRMPRGSLRSVLAELHQDRNKAERAFRRVIDVASSQQAGPSAGGKALEPFLQALKTLTGAEGLFSPEGDTPLHDAVELMAAEGRKRAEGEVP